MSLFTHQFRGWSNVQALATYFAGCYFYFHGPWWATLFCFAVPLIMTLIMVNFKPNDKILSETDK